MTAVDPIDRILPTLEPEGTAVMRQDWHHLLFLHWEVPPAELQPLIPPELTLDTFDGIAYIGLVPFTLTGVRPVLTPPIPGISSFHEVNVRTYVHLRGAAPGVWFFSLDASSALAVTAARATYHLPYFHARIDLAATDDPLPAIDFTSHRDDPRGPMPAHVHTRYGPADGVTKHAAPGTIEHFLLERYILYSIDSRHQVRRARVHHQPYAIQRVEVGHLEETLIWAAGIRRPEGLHLRHYTREVHVKVYPPEQV